MVYCGFTCDNKSQIIYVYEETFVVIRIWCPNLFTIVISFVLSYGLLTHSHLNLLLPLMQFLIPRTICDVISFNSHRQIWPKLVIGEEIFGTIPNLEQ